MKPRREPGKPAFDAGRVDPGDLGLALAQLPHDHDLVVAARLALEVRADAMHSGDDYPGGRYHRIHEFTAHDDVQRHRWGPTGDRDLWIRYGPDGPPKIPEQRAPVEDQRARTAETVARAREACQLREEPAQWAPPAAEDGHARVRGL